MPGLRVCQAAIPALDIKGTDCTKLAHCVRIYESMCKPYRTFEFVMLNTDGQINELSLQIGDTVEFVIANGERATYSATTYVIGLPEQFSTDGIRKDMVTIVTASAPFMQDRGALVQESYKNMPISTAIQMISGQYLKTGIRLMPSLGMIATDSSGGVRINNEKPFTAIRNLANRMTYGGVGTGSTVFFEDKDGLVMGPLENFFTNMSVATDIIQKDTWGSSWRHLFAGEEAKKAILASKVYHREVPAEEGGQTGSSGSAIAAASQAKTLVDVGSKGIEVTPTRVFNTISTVVPFIGRYGGVRNILNMDSSRNSPSIDPSVKAEMEKAFRAKVRDGTNFLIKTTMDSGFKMTVGKGVEVVLAAPLLSPYNAIQGNLLIADLMHEAFFDNREVMGTTTLRGVKIDW
jgi:hypothetical protein